MLHEMVLYLSARETAPERDTKKSEIPQNFKKDFEKDRKKFLTNRTSYGIINKLTA